MDVERENRSQSQREIAPSTGEEDSTQVQVHACLHEDGQAARAKSRVPKGEGASEERPAHTFLAQVA